MTVSGAPVWAVVPAAAVLLALAWAAAVLDAVLDAGPSVPGPRRGPGRGYGLGRASAPGSGGRAWARPLAEATRLMRQGGRTTVAPDRLLWRVGTAGPLVAALLMAAVVPVGGTVVADLPVGIVWFNAVDVTLWAAVWLAGWGPNSVYPLVGGYRFVAQALGYELPLMFALTAPAVAAESLRVGEVVRAQQPLWFAVWMPVAFLVFLASVAAFSMWGPFASPVGRDAAGGVLAEAAGVDRLLVLAGRYALLAAGAGMAVALFLGGGAGPWLPGWAWSLLKTLAVLAVLVALRRLPLLHPERLALLGWLVALPAVLLQVLVVAVVVVWKG
ncbi:NADH-quinone oxidoreductase subunit H [Streptomyces sp. WMMC1477]|uniref:NADH-quinone oxidoreductase subunit H n=1 Tax=Streptomyces sp. WMMC1477 TaxID=3015155 RepID=UPI0022B5ECA1|nr:NADH-quinone oxidoreductase subunit H [Streptomyces sp. WMMC1477]MCZ7433638.1 NADH-quinone oxidoreductase subunit H [Streptomyces sp. WMMC1477]